MEEKRLDVRSRSQECDLEIAECGLQIFYHFGKIHR